MCKEVLVIEQTFAMQLGDIYEDLEEIKDQISFLHRVTIMEDTEDLVNLNNYTNGKAKMIENLENNLKTIMEKIKFVGTQKEDEES